MPLIARFHDASASIQIAVWQADGSEANSLQQSGCGTEWWQPPAHVRHPSRQRDWLAARAAAGVLLRETGQPCRLVRSETGRPELVGSDRLISLTHSRGWAAAAISDSPIGIDLEQHRQRASWESARMFMNDSELRFWQEDLQASAAGFYLIWSTKEGMYKALQQRVGEGLSFRRHLAAIPLWKPDAQPQGLIAARCTHPKAPSESLWRGLRLGDFWLTWGRMGKKNPPVRRVT